MDISEHRTPPFGGFDSVCMVLELDCVGMICTVTQRA